MTINECLKQIISKLNENNLEDSSIIARKLLEHTLNQNRQYIVVNGNKNLTCLQINQIEKNTQKIIDGKPIQYITHEQAFMNEKYYVDENVLIPQPDTEILVYEALKICESLESIKLLDLCTGSGAIAISIEKALANKKHEIFASDISDSALVVANKNKEKNNANVTFIKSNLLENINENDFDVIVSNPPYIETKVIENLSKQVKNEPMLALDGGEDGLDFYRKIIENAYKYIKNNGYLCLEIGYKQAKSVCVLLEQEKMYKHIKVIKDLNQNDRCVICKIVKE